MNNKVINKIFLSLLVFVLLVCSFLLINKTETTKALCNLDDTSGLTIHKNVVLSEHTNENYKKFAIEETYSTTYCSGYKSLKDGSPLDFSAGGVMLEATASGESSVIRLIETARSETLDIAPTSISNGFSIIGQPIMENVYYSNTDDFDAIVPDYKTIEFTFGDLDSDAYIKFKLEGSRYSTVYITVSGKTSSGQDIVATAKPLINTSFYGPAGYVKDGSDASVDRNIPLLLNFDPANPQLYGVITGGKSNYSEVAVDESIVASLPRIENYYVDMAFLDKSQSNTAKFLIYELCTQSLAGTQIVDTTLPVVQEIISQENMVKGNAYAFQAKAFDIIDDVITDQNLFEYTVTRKSDSFVVLPNEEKEFFFEQSGEYVVSVKAKDRAGNISSAFQKNIVIEEEDLVSPNIFVQGVYRDSYYIGEQIKIFDAICEDNSNTVHFNVDVSMNSNKVDCENGIIATNKIGKYEVRYFAEDLSGNFSISKYSFEIFDVDVPIDLDYDYSLDTIYLPQLIIPNGWYYKTSLYLSSDTEKNNPLNITDGGYIFDVGDYKLVYSLISSSTEQFVKEFEVNVKMKGDVEKPTLRILGEYQPTYKIDDIVDILPAIATDDSGSCDLEIKVFLDEEEIEFENNSLVIEKGGRYTIRYTAKDLSGNITQIEKSFEVAKQGLAGWKITLIVVASVLAVAGASAFIIIKLRKKQKSKEN